ncbi:MAG: SRPBCC family protein [Nocardioides sp.]
MKHIVTVKEIAAPPAEVWAVLTDFASHQQWNPFFASISGQARVGQRLTVVARKGDGTGMTFRPRVLVADGSTLRWKGKLAWGGIFDGEHEFALSALPGDRTKLEHGEKFTGFLVPLMGGLLRRTRVGFLAFNDALAVRVAQVHQ